MIETAKLIANFCYQPGSETEVKDKGGAPYIDHLRRVAEEMEGNEEAEQVAWLHDVVEDGRASLLLFWTMGFPVAVIDAIKAISRRPYEPYKAYILRVGENALARKVKMADLRDNLLPERRMNINDALVERYTNAFTKLWAIEEAFA